jgi:hypothetical protein
VDVSSSYVGPPQSTGAGDPGPTRPTGNTGPTGHGATGVTGTGGEAGTLNPDLTPNEVTAARLGWELKDRSAERLAPSEAGGGDSDAQPSRYGSQRDPGDGQ